MNTQVRIATSLRNAPGRPMTSEELDAEVRRAWLERGVVVIFDPASIANEFVRQGLINEMTRRYGRRMKRGN